MKRLSRHTVVVLLVALLSSVGGMTLAVVAFGQGDGAPTSGYTTTPTSDTTPLSPYATTPSTTPAATTPAATTPTRTSTTPSEATTTNGANPVRKHGTAPVPTKENGGAPPSRATREGPSHLAFTGAEPIYVGLFGAALMAGGLMLHRRRRAATDR
jgi:hypothetical protein